jgi:thymidine kinase
MFLEPLISADEHRGWIEVITGPMFSGKTEELIRRLKRATIALKKVAIFKPSIDKRYSRENIVSHDSNQITSIMVDRAIEILEYYDDAEVIGIDEVQFFNEAIVDVVQFLALKGKRVIIAGLDMDSSGKPFGPMPALLTISEYITKLHAICVDCGSLASFSFRLVANEDLVVIGARDKYKPLCRRCFSKQTKENFDPET